MAVRAWFAAAPTLARLRFTTASGLPGSTAAALARSATAPRRTPLEAGTARPSAPASPLSLTNLTAFLGRIFVCPALTPVPCRANNPVGREPGDIGALGH